MQAVGAQTGSAAILAFSYGRSAVWCRDDQREMVAAPELSDALE